MHRHGPARAIAWRTSHGPLSYLCRKFVKSGATNQTVSKGTLSGGASGSCLYGKVSHETLILRHATRTPLSSFYILARIMKNHRKTDLMNRKWFGIGDNSAISNKEPIFISDRNYLPKHTNIAISEKGNILSPERIPSFPDHRYISRKVPKLSPTCLSPGKCQIISGKIWCPLLMWCSNSSCRWSLRAYGFEYAPQNSCAVRKY